MTTRMPNRLRTLAFAALTFASACGAGDFVAPQLSTGDRYTLHSFNGAALPALLSATEQSRVALLDDSFEFFEGGRYVERGHVRTTTNGVETIQTLESPGTFTRLGSAVTLVSSSGTINGSFTDLQTLTIMAGRNTLVFRH